MTSIVFDPDARAELLAAVRYYESCQSGLGRRFRIFVQSALQKDKVSVHIRPEELIVIPDKGRK